MLSSAAFAAAARASAENLGWRADDSWHLALAPAHVGGLSILVRCLAARRAVVLGDLAGATLASMVPTQLHRLVAAGVAPPPSLRAVLVGGAPTPPALLARSRAAAWPVLTTYGLTETCGQVATQRPGARGPGAHPLPGASVRIAPAGTIQVTGPMLMSGYLGQPAPFTDDGWLDTGDLGRLDDEGNLHVLARRTDLIVSGGENVYPAEVEAALLEIPGVAGACVFGVADELWGQVVCAALVCAGPGPDDAELRAHLAARLAGFKRPRRIARLDALTVGGSGKLDRAATAARALGLLRTIH